MKEDLFEDVTVPKKRESILTLFRRSRGSEIKYVTSFMNGTQVKIPHLQDNCLHVKLVTYCLQRNVNLIRLGRPGVTPSSISLIVYVLCTTLKVVEHNSWTIFKCVALWTSIGHILITILPISSLFIKWLIIKYRIGDIPILTEARNFCPLFRCNNEVSLIKLSAKLSKSFSKVQLFLYKNHIIAPHHRSMGHVSTNCSWMKRSLHVDYHFIKVSLFENESDGELLFKESHKHAVWYSCCSRVCIDNNN